MQDAIVRAQAYIGDRAPAEFRRNLQWVSTFTIQSGQHLPGLRPQPGRTSGPTASSSTPRKPFDRSVRFSGYESNATFSDRG